MVVRFYVMGSNMPRFPNLLRRITKHGQRYVSTWREATYLDALIHTRSSNHGQDFLEGAQSMDGGTFLPDGTNMP